MDSECGKFEKDGRAALAGDVGAAGQPVAQSPKWGALLTAKEVAAYLKCDVSTVYDLAHGGRLRFISLTGNTDKHKRGRKALRILASSVDDLVTTGLAEREAAPVPEPEPVVMPAPPRSARATKRARAARTRVVLPYPGQRS